MSELLKIIILIVIGAIAIDLLLQYIHPLGLSVSKWIAIFPGKVFVWTERFFHALAEWCNKRWHEAVTWPPKGEDEHYTRLSDEIHRLLVFVLISAAIAAEVGNAYTIAPALFGLQLHTTLPFSLELVATALFLTVPVCFSTFWDELMHKQSKGWHMLDVTDFQGHRRLFLAMSILGFFLSIVTLALLAWYRHILISYPQAQLHPTKALGVFLGHSYSLADVRLALLVLLGILLGLMYRFIKPALKIGLSGVVMLALWVGEAVSKVIEFIAMALAHGIRWLCFWWSRGLVDPYQEPESKPIGNPLSPWQPFGPSIDYEPPYVGIGEGDTTMKVNEIKNASLWFIGSFGSRARSPMALATRREGVAGLLLTYVHIDLDRSHDDDDPFAGLGIENISPTRQQITDIWHMPGTRTHKLELLFNLLAENYTAYRGRRRLQTTPSPIIIFASAALVKSLQPMIEKIKSGMDHTAILVVTELNKRIAQNMSQQARLTALEKERGGFDALQALYEKGDEMGIEAVLLLSDPSPFSAKYSPDTQWHFLSEGLVSLLRGKYDDKSNLSCYEILKYLHRHSPVVSIAVASESVDIETPFRLIKWFKRDQAANTLRGNERGRVDVYNAVNKMRQLFNTMLTQETTRPTRAFDLPARMNHVEVAIISIPIPPSETRRWGKFSAYVALHRPVSFPQTKSIVARGAGARYPVSSNEPLVMQVSLIYALVARPVDLLASMEAPRELAAPAQDGNVQPAPAGDLAEIDEDQPAEQPQQVNGNTPLVKKETRSRGRKTSKTQPTDAATDAAQPSHNEE